MINPNPYELLGVSTDASSDEIKKKFRTLQLKQHPDKDRSTANRDNYVKLCEAYEVLSDPHKRSRYDSTSQYCERANSIIEREHDNLQNDMLFKNLFTKFAEQHEKNLNKIQIQTQIQPIVKNVHVSFIDAFKGTVVPVEIERDVIYDNKQDAKTYQKEKAREIEKELIYVEIHEGIDNGEIILVKEKGNIINHAKGDVKLIISLDISSGTTNANLSRSGLDLIYHQTISLKEALCGVEFDVEHLNGKSYRISDGGQVINDKYEKRINGLGFKRGSVTGDLIIKFNVKYPKQITGEQRERLKEVL